MGIQFFGEFLIDRWVITRGQLIEALELQEYRNLKFGNVAVQKQYLTEEQVERINEQQKSQDLKFADLAISLGMLTKDQASEILTYQKNNHLFLGEALLELGHITEDILERELAIFNEEQARYEIEKVEIPEGIKEVSLLEASVDLTRKMFNRVADVLVKVGAGQVEGSGTEEKKPEYHLTVQVKFEGSGSADYLLSVSSDVAVCIATAILKEDATRESEAVVEDAVKEFCNIVCGNAVAKMAQMGSQVDISPPESLPGIPQLSGDDSYVVFPVHLGEGGVDLRFCLRAASES